jgi:hypothetical protein
MPNTSPIDHAEVGRQEGQMGFGYVHGFKLPRKLISELELDLIVLHAAEAA